MNERIKELAKQADLAVTKPDGHYIVQEWQEKFAKLIVRECSSFVYNYPERYLTRNQSREICNAMEDYFGVTKDE